MEWRRAAWAGAGLGILGIGGTMFVTWLAAIEGASRAVAWWPLIPFGVLMVGGLVLFFIAMFKAEWLPDYELSIREQRAAEAKQEARRNSPLRSVFHHETPAERANHELARAMDEHTIELRAQRTGGGGVLPLSPPTDYQIRALRQVLPDIKSAMPGFDAVTLAAAMANAKRSDTNPIFEPLHGMACQDGLAELAAAGELVAFGPGVWRFPPDVASPADPQAPDTEPSLSQGDE